MMKVIAGPAVAHTARPGPLPAGGVPGTNPTTED